MTNPEPPRIRVIRFGLRGWAAILVGLLVLGAITILALGFFVLLLPVLLLAPILYYFLPRPKAGQGEPGVIDGEFRVVGAQDSVKEIERKPDGKHAKDIPGEKS